MAKALNEPVAEAKREGWALAVAETEAWAGRHETTPLVLDGREPEK
jgi:hypothetical protein